jgi:L-threonylcarbamoyladenylate synthase
MEMVHYAPLTPLYLVDNTNQIPNSLYSKKTGFLSYNDFNPMFDKKDQFVLSKNLNLYEIAQNLYRALHELDSKGYDILIAEYVPNTGIGLAINDRLTRAATNSISSNYTFKNR